jgi:proteasome accessory factor A
MTAVQIQQEIRNRVTEALADSLVGHDQLVLDVWGDILDDLAGDPMTTSDRLDWTAKLSLLNAYRARGLEWTDPRLAMVDIQYHDIDPAKGLYNALVRKGRIRTLVPPEEVRAAVTTPPTTTRAWLRGEVARRFPDQLLAANWDSLILDVPCAGSSATRVLLSDPSRATAAELEDALATVTDAAGLIAVLTEIMPESVLGLD